MRTELRISLCVLLLVALFPNPDFQGAAAQSSSPKRGGRLIASQASGPRSFNYLLANDQDSLTLLDCLMGVLVRVNRQTTEPELELAESVRHSSDHKILTVRLRKGVRFSDGQPLTAEDVVFTFQVLYDPALRSPVVDLLELDGKKIEVKKLDDSTLQFTFPKPYAPAERLFDAVYILPKHVLEPLYRQGRFQSAWNLATPPNQIVGLGPFMLKEFVPGQRVVLTRNPHYWKRDRAGQPLPYLDELTFVMLPDRSARLLRFRQGELDLLSPLTPEEAAGLQPQVNAGRIKVTNIGPSLITELMWFNLNPQAKGINPVKAAWFQDVRFRQAISFAIDRQAIIDVVFSGKASPLWGPVPESSKWFNPKVKKYPHNPEQARRLLGQLGFSDRNRDGVLEDEKGNELAFTVLTNAETPLRERIGLTIQEDLKKAGIKMTLTKLAASALLSKINETYDYEACLFAIALGDTDPSSTRNVLMSSGATHWWNPQQKTPATEWERRIDQLLDQYLLAFDPKQRKAYFDDVQAILSEQVPFAYLVSRDLIVGAKANLKNLKPGVLRDFLLWNVEELYLE